MKIAYCLNSIRYLGGIQRVTIVKANALASIPGNDVYVIVTDNKGGEKMGELDARIHLIDLDVNYYKDDWKSRFHLLRGIIVKGREHRKKLSEALYRIQPDIVVSVGQSEKGMLPRIKGQWKTIREFHFVSDYRMRHATTAFQKILAFGGDFIDKHFTLKKYDQIVVLTEEDKQLNWSGWTNVIVMPNPSTFHCEEPSTLDSYIIVTAGRLNAQKNYSSLVRSFKDVAMKHPSWRLKIYGSGEERAMLESLIYELGLKDKVKLGGFTNDIKAGISKASAAVYTSIYEGFPLSIIEAMECGLPVVSYSCPCGPKDIIDDGKDGFLVEVNDEKSLAEKICLLIEDEELRKNMGIEARKKAGKYHVDIITQKWMTLFKELCGNWQTTKYDFR